MTSKAYRRLPLGSYGPMDVNNAYWIPETGALVDPGPPRGRFWQALTEELQRVGASVEDVEFVLVTHWHTDHAGLAPRLAEAADATLVMHAEDASLVGDYGEQREKRLVRDGRRMREWGVPDSRVEGVVDGDKPSEMPVEFPIQSLEDGEEVAGLEALHTPGHTLGHAAFLLDDHAFVGDAVLPGYTTNYGGSDTRMTDPLARYARTLDRLRDESATASPGHGGSLDLQGRIEQMTAHWESRAQEVLDATRRLEPATPWDVARDLFEEMDGIHTKLGAGEAAAQLVRLAALGALEETADGYVTRGSVSVSELEYPLG